jgi:hypothetical protein
MNERTRAALIEAVLSPHRERDRDGRLVPPPEWWDLPPDAHDELAREGIRARLLEKAMDPRGRSGTVRAVMVRIGEL